MMMMRTAGGPSAPVWTQGGRKRALPAWVWAAAVLSVGAHLGAGAWLLSQKWTPPEVIVDEGPIFKVQTFRLPKPPEPEILEREQAPPASPPVLNDPPPAQTPTETILYRPLPDAQPGPGPVIDLTPAPNPRPDGTGTVAVVDPAPLGVISNPDWVRRPTGEALMRAYPDRALNADVTGSARLSCTVRVDGTLTGCAVAEESPSGYGFGRAALRLSRDFRMSPRTVDGQAVEGARVNVTLRFTLPQD